MVKKKHTDAKHMGRPRNVRAVSHTAIMDAIYQLLQERHARDLTMEAIAKKAGVGKPTLYKWWPSKASLILAMFNERLVSKPLSHVSESSEANLRTKLYRLIDDFNGMFGRVIAELIAEAQGDSEVLEELHQYIEGWRKATVDEIERGKATSEFKPGTNPELVIDLIFGAAYYRLLLGFGPMSRKYGRELILQLMEGIRNGG